MQHPSSPKPPRRPRANRVQASTGDRVIGDALLALVRGQSARRTPRFDELARRRQLPAGALLRFVADLAAQHLTTEEQAVRTLVVALELAMRQEWKNAETRRAA